MQKNNENKLYNKLTLTVIIVGIILRFSLASVYHVAGDACWHLSAARFMAENKEFPLHQQFGREEPFWAPPFFHIMSAVFYSIFGYFGSKAAEFGMKMLSPLMGSLTLVFICLINRKLFNEKITFYSMLFTAFVPMMIDYNVFAYIDSTVTFFIVLSVYFALDGKYIKSSIAAGLAAITKYNGIFILPLLIYIAYKNTRDKKILAKKLLLIFIIPIAIATPWFIRNYYNFGNPFWPFFNFIFHGYPTTAFESADLQSFSLSSIFSINSITFTYLAIFGVPDGNYRNIFFFSIPHLKLFFSLWLLGTLFFIFPFAKSRIKDKSKLRIIAIWIFLFLAVLILYIGNAGWTAGRFFMPAIPALGMLWGNGLSNMKFKKQKAKILFFVILTVALVGIVAAESTKVVLASWQWNLYEGDFLWVRQNTSKNSVIVPGGQCLAYNIHRTTLLENAENLKKADYIWLNKNFNVEPRSVAKGIILKELQEKNYNKVYENKETGTLMYKIK